ncbi:hypothetical protein LMG27174_03476 [Paraburkholderia rhynchosiae]|uniref:Uncharacterized protein n=1 Tax=Paraburkholderia rhynchosiae TaxID=487049 RepID=A0A6J5B963_9BURK|nr:hypothetical protein LMG27174_03476 [Paraburkholderia rhynchosiae]
MEAMDRQYGSHNGCATVNRKVKVIYGVHSADAIRVMNLKLA